MTVTVPGSAPTSGTDPADRAAGQDRARGAGGGPAAGGPPDGPERSRARRLLRGPSGGPAWVRPSVLALLLATAVLYLWGLGASGWANSFYSAAVQAGTTSWKAFFFGSFDSSSFITVDKPPASLWVMELSARMFGLSSWSILVPQALEGVASVGLLYLTVRRRFTPAAGLIAGAVLAGTPVATLMFRFNNPDALLVLLLVGAAYATTRALERGRTGWLLLAAALVGTGFLTKMLQAFILVPVFAGVYLLTSPAPVRRRLAQLAAAGAALAIASGWWVAIVSLFPASARPYIGGSQTNSVLELVLGYNGFGRLTGNESGSVGGGAGTTGRWGATGLTRLFGSDMGTQISWLLPAALILLVATLWLWRRAPRTDGRRAAVLLWGGWLLLSAVVFSFAQGIIHAYYTVALAPAVGALVGIGSVVLWQQRNELRWVRMTLALALATTSVWAWQLLGRTPEWAGWLRVAVLVTGLGAAAALAATPRLVGRLGVTLAVAALLAALAAPTAFALQTAATPHSGAIPTAGPAGASTGGFGGRPGGVPPGATGPGGAGAGAPPQGAAGAGGFGPGRGGPGQAQAGTGGARAGGLGGLLDSAAPSGALVTLLTAHASSYAWVAATVGANSAAGVQLASRQPVLAIGGFNGTDPTPTLAEFEQLVAQGRIHYFLSSGTGFGGAATGSGTSSQITTWVERTFTSTTVGGVTVYDLTTAAASAGSSPSGSSTAS